MQAVFRPFEIEAFEAQMDSDQDSNQLNIDQAETGSNSSDSGVNSGSGKLKFKFENGYVFLSLHISELILVGKRLFYELNCIIFAKTFFPLVYFIALGFNSALQIQHGKYTILTR